MLMYLFIGVIVILFELIRCKDFFDDPLFKKYEKMFSKYGKLGQFIIKASYVLWAIELALLWPVSIIASIIGFILSNTGFRNQQRATEIQQNLENAGNNIINNLDILMTEIKR